MLIGRIAELLGGPATRFGLDEAAWREALGAPVFDGLLDADLKRLREVAADLLHARRFSGAGGQEMGAYEATLIAAFAALPVMALGAAAYGDWLEVIVYPGEFLYEGHETDPDGIVHHIRHARAGEAMAGGPMVLSWQDVLASGTGEGYNVVIHEFAHKLDMANGAVDGLPPLHPGMSVAAWAEAFNAAYQDICRRADAGEEPAIDPYAAESPAECFAVFTEYFFEMPDVLAEAYPAVYEQMRLYYKQDPLSRIQLYDAANP